MRKLAFTFIAIATSYFSTAQVLINEYSCANVSTITDNYGNNEDWIELYNAGTSAVTLTGYYLSDKATNPTKWQIPTLNLAAGARKVFWCSGKDIVVGTNFHTNFKLTQTKFEDIVLADASGAIIDQLVISPNLADHSHGRTTDGAATWGVFTSPTPNAANTGALQEYLPKPTFSIQAGGYAASQTLTLSTTAANAQIRYTLDGTEPTSTSPLYATPLTISATTVVRAKTFSTVAGVAASFIETNTYFINDMYSLPVVSMCGDFNGLFNGFGGQVVNSFELFWFNEQFVHEGDGFTRGHGNDSWAFPQKGMRFYAQDEYGYANNIEKQLFPTSPRDEFDVVILKAAGSDNYPAADAQNGVPSCHLRDAFVQTITDKYNLEIDFRRVQRCIVFLNGEYWGIYELRERVDSDYTDYYYDQPKNKVDMLEYWGGLTVEEGSDTAWVNLYNFMMSNNLAVPANYTHVDNRLNLLSFIDYFILNTYTNNSDWLNWNTAWWRGRKSPGVKWRYQLWDQDNTYDLGENYTGLPSTGFDNDPCNVTELDFGGGSDVGHVDMFNALWVNQNFKDLYINRYADLMNTVFVCDTLNHELDLMVNELTPEMPRHLAKWGGSMTGWQANLTHLRDQINGRCTVITGDLSDCYTLSGPYALNVNVSPTGAGDVRVNTYTPSAYSWTGNYFGGVNVSLKATANPGYVFSHWTLTQAVNPNTNADSVWLDLTQNDNVTAVFLPTVPPTLVDGALQLLTPGGALCSNVVSPLFTFTNTGDTLVGSFTVNYQVSGFPPQTYTWNGNLSMGQSVNITLPAQTLNFGAQTLSLNITDVNGLGADDVAANNSGSVNITVTAVAGAQTPLVEGFEAAFPPTHFTINNPAGTTWQQTGNAARSGVKSAYIDNATLNNIPGAIDDLHLEGFELPANQTSYLSFDWAYAPYSVGVSDTLELLVSANCGQSFTPLFVWYNAALATTAPTQVPFVPNAPNQWKHHQISLAAYTGNPNIEFIFRNRNAYENNLYLDNINLISTPVSIEETENISSLVLYPNPAQQQVNISFFAAKENSFELSLLDLSGKEIRKEYASSQAGQNTRTFSLENLPAGIYLLELKLGAERVRERLVVR